MCIEEIISRDSLIVDELLKIWESSVRATHHFLTEVDIQEIKPQVKQGLNRVTRLFVCRDDRDIHAFIGVEGDRVEMLFVGESARGRGIGKRLLHFACTELDARSLDVNEQNTQAVGFYHHFGFKTVGRSDLDDQGRPFPLLHLSLS